MKTEIVNLNDKLISVDISQLIKSDTLYFNATEIAKQFEKRVQHYLDSQQTKDLISVILEAGKTAFKLEKHPIKNEDLVIVKQGRYGGTWLHNSLAIDFARWCSPKFAYILDRWILTRLQEEKQRKHDRQIARLEYPELTDAIQEYLTTGKDSDKWLYSNEADLLNKIVLGCKAKRFCEINGIDRLCLRDNLSQGQITLLNRLQKFDTSMIQLNYTYEQRKEKLEEYYGKLVAKLLN